MPQETPKYENDRATFPKEQRKETPNMIKRYRYATKVGHSQINN